MKQQTRAGAGRVQFARVTLHVFRVYACLCCPSGTVKPIDVVAIHHARWDTAALSCSLITVCSGLPGLSVVSMSHGWMTALKLCAATIMEHSTSSCIYDSIKKLHKDKGLVCYPSSLPPIFLHFSQSLAQIYVTTQWWKIDKCMVNIKKSWDICRKYRNFPSFVIFRWHACHLSPTCNV